MDDLKTLVVGGRRVEGGVYLVQALEQWVYDVGPFKAGIESVSLC